MQKHDDDVLLKVEHLCQYFKMSPGRELKAVDDVSFDIKKGEVFGLVGESGCGKTTTGRSIIKLYDITSGNVWFKGQRICAGTRSYKEAIRAAKEEYAQERSRLRAECKKACEESPERKKELLAQCRAAIAEKKAALSAVVSEQKQKIRLAKYDHKNCEKTYFERLKTEYAEKLKAANGDVNALSEEDKETYRSVINQPKIPKKVWFWTALAFVTMAVVLLATCIAQYAVFEQQYGDYQAVSARVDSSDAQAGTTTVSFTVDNEEDEPVDYQVVLNYFDPALGVSTPEQTVRLRVYFSMSNPAENVLTEKPAATTALVLLICFLVAAAVAIVIRFYVNERYNPSRLITQIQMIFQDPIASLNPRMTVKDIIAEGLVIEGVKDKKYIEKQVYDVLELVGLVPEHAGRYPHEFSGGQRQRIGVARSVIMRPELIIADEPVSALDVSIQAQVINLLNDLRSKLGLTILFIAHDLSVVKYFSDRIGVMYFGKMVELAPSDELFEHPLHPYTKSLLSAIPLPDPAYEKTRKRFVYNPLAEHDYSQEQPTMQEVAPGHFVLCNTQELEKYRAELEQA